MTYMILYEEESQGLEGPEKVSTRWPARCHVTRHVHVAELKETAPSSPPYQHSLCEGDGGLRGCRDMPLLPSLRNQHISKHPTTCSY